MRRQILQVGAILFFGFAAPLTAQSGMVLVTESSSPEAKLAVIELGSTRVPAAKIREFGRYLDDRERHCRDSRTHLGEMTLAAQRELKERYGKSITIKELLRAEARMMRESGLVNQSCGEAFAILVIGLGGS